MVNSDNFLDKQNEGMVFEEKRSYRRVPVNLDANFFCSNMFYSGEITNLSETGMFINTRHCLPVGTILVVSIHNKNKFSRVFVKIQRIKRENMNSDGVGVELMKPSRDYEDLVIDLKTTN
jgi:Tfp pilus assembly protein PilZ